jgi:hypothetical protein
VALDLSALAYFAGSSNIRSQRMKSREEKRWSKAASEPGKSGKYIQHGLEEVKG